MVNLYKLPASNARFKETKDRYRDVLDNFESYAEQLTIDAGRSIKRSNKAGSYKNYLVRFILLYEDIFNDNIDSLNSFDTLNKFEMIVKLPEFKPFNNKTSRFFSATFSCFNKFLIYENSLAEAQSDEMLTNDFFYVPTSNNEMSYKLATKPELRKNKSVLTSRGYAYSRNPFESLTAKSRSDWKCELNGKHTTFISSTDRKPFLEAHHLVPMYVQDKYTNTLDFADNIVPLCPNCHRLVHHSEEKVRKDALAKLYENRKNLYEKHGININLKTLLSFYEIF